MSCPNGNPASGRQPVLPIVGYKRPDDCTLRPDARRKAVIMTQIFEVLSDGDVEARFFTEIEALRFAEKLDDFYPDCGIDVSSVEGANSE